MCVTVCKLVLLTVSQARLGRASTIGADVFIAAQSF